MTKQDSENVSILIFMLTFFYLKGMIYRTPNFLFAFVGVYECRFEPSPGKACEFFLKNLIYISGQKGTFFLQEQPPKVFYEKRHS